MSTHMLAGMTRRRMTLTRNHPQGRYLTAKPNRRPHKRPAYGSSKILTRAR